jgi:hypothetical protein
MLIDDEMWLAVFFGGQDLATQRNPAIAALRLCGSAPLRFWVGVQISVVCAIFGFSGWLALRSLRSLRFKNCASESVSICVICGPFGWMGGLCDFGSLRLCVEFGSW